MHNKILTLFAARDAAHKLHLGTRSFAQHLALEDLYKGLTKSADKIAEVWQGKYGIMALSASGDEGFMQLAGQQQTDAAAFVKQLSVWVEDVRKTLNPEDSAIVNLWDELAALVYQAKYKIDNLH